MRSRLKPFVTDTVGLALAHDSAELHVRGAALYIDDMREPEGTPTVLAPSFAAALALVVALWGVIQLGIMPAPIFDLAQSAVLPLLR